jgi:methionyl-tRNA formyltransferase
MKKYKIIFIGNRPAILKSLILRNDIEIVSVYSTNYELINLKIFPSLNIFNGLNQNNVFDSVKKSKFDILLSAGCPYHLPIEKFPANNIYLNIHPSYLPFGKGPNPINEYFLAHRKYYGITLHFISSKFDAGNIVYQKKIKLTHDLDLSLIYLFIFDLERDIFLTGLNKLIATRLKFSGKPQVGKGNFFSRKQFFKEIDIAELSTDKFIRFVKAFSIESQSIVFIVKTKRMRFFYATKIISPFLKKKFQCLQVGDIFQINNRNIILRLKDGLVRINDFSYE